jgi:hypothetical protein
VRQAKIAILAALLMSAVALAGQPAPKATSHGGGPTAGGNPSSSPACILMPAIFCH